MPAKTPKKQRRRTRPVKTAKRVAAGWRGPTQELRKKQIVGVERGVIRKAHEEATIVKNVIHGRISNFDELVQKIINSKEIVGKKQAQKRLLAYSQIAASHACDAIGVGRGPKGMEQRKKIYDIARRLTGVIIEIKEKGVGQTQFNKTSRLIDEVQEIVGWPRVRWFEKIYSKEFAALMVAQGNAGDAPAIFAPDPSIAAPRKKHKKSK